MTQLLPIAVLISGGGTTLKNLIRCRDLGTLPVEFRLVISSRSDATGLQFAYEASIPTLVVPKLRIQTAEEHSESVFRPIRESGARLVVMGGYLHHVLIPNDFENRVVNIHPSLIPSFCGKGMYSGSTRYRTFIFSCISKRPLNNIDKKSWVIIIEIDLIRVKTGPDI